MSRFALATIITAWLLSAQCTSAEETTICPAARTQAEMNECTRDIFLAADAELNRVYQRILREYEDDAVFIEKLRKAQRAWLAFRDAELEALYPHLEEDALAHYGSVWPVCINLVLEEMTMNRVADLRRWLEGVKEGEVCAGSVRHE
jgi:uncharacterized protein YecT (DUF1311 family)